MADNLFLVGFLRFMAFSLRVFAFWVDKNNITYSG